jgi:predicted DCC family thiol-disulfide oxidoreductase YuxK
MPIPKKPTMLYDGDCGFCTHWISKWQRITGESVVYFPFQQKLKEFPQVTPEQCKQAVQLILPDGKVHSGAHAVFIAFSLAGKYSFLLWLYDHLPLFDRFSEFLYQLIAEHRFLLSKLYRLSKKCDV